MSLYVIVSSDLSHGMQTSQAMHAMRAFAAEHPEAERAWFEHDNAIVVVKEKYAGYSLGDIASEFPDLLHSEWREPDLDGMRTAVAFVLPRLAQTPKALRRLKLVG